MSFCEDDYAALRPFLYHLTDLRNFERISRTRNLQSAGVLLDLVGQSHIARTRRNDKISVDVDGELVTLCDQLPLYEGNIQFANDWTMPDLIEHLNRFVFFWSGWNRGPVVYGVRHFLRYSEEQPRIIRAAFQSLRGINSAADVRFCKYNSGSPRCNTGRRSPRGPDTFARAKSCSFKPSDVVEVVFKSSVALPEDTEWASNIAGPWSALRD
jgi:hypothetical protein